jgi:hypothetical protein
MSKHTKGPWQILPEEADKDYIRIRGTVCGGRYKVANVPTPTYAGVHPRELAETCANAALIAAAPELLAALENIINAYDAPNKSLAAPIADARKARSKAKCSE